MATFLVTGGAGFIGSHLCESLCADGHRVRVLDDLSTGKRENLPGGVDLTVGDVADLGGVIEAMAGVDGCFHLAAVASVERSHEDWVGTHRANLTGAVAVFEAARRTRPAEPAPVVYASSAAVYGDNPELPLSEDAATSPMSAYGADKLGCEFHARVARRVHGVRAVGMRFFNVYGPRQDPRSPYSGVISVFCDRMRQARPVTVFGDGNQTRDFVFVTDVVRAMRAAMERPDKAPLYNVCTGRATTVLELAQALGSVLGSRPVVERAAPRVGEVRHSLGDPCRLDRELGVRSAVSLRDGLALTLRRA
jgi:UDP-glucose 4-epimerase